MSYLSMDVTLTPQQFWEGALLACGIQQEHLQMAQQIQIGNYLSGFPIKHLLTIELTIHCFMKHLMHSRI